MTSHGNQLPMCCSFVVYLSAKIRHQYKKEHSVSASTFFFSFQGHAFRPGEAEAPCHIKYNGKHTQKKETSYYYYYK